MNVDFEFPKLQYNKEKPMRGKILISEPYALDDYFKRSVVLITEHNENGTVGFILNKPVKMTLSELIDGFPVFDAMVSVGGPVSTDTLHYIHTLGDLIPKSMNIAGNLYWGGNYETIKMLIKQGQIQTNQIRFFLGYAGWQANQLANELKHNYWLVSKIDEINVMKSHTKIWEMAVAQIDKRYHVWSVFPDEPMLN